MGRRQGPHSSFMFPPPGSRCLFRSGLIGIPMQEHRAFLNCLTPVGLSRPPALCARTKLLSPLQNEGWVGKSSQQEWPRVIKSFRGDRRDLAYTRRSVNRRNRASLPDPSGPHGPLSLRTHLGPGAERTGRRAFIQAPAPRMR